MLGDAVAVYLDGGRSARLPGRRRRRAPPSSTPPASSIAERQAAHRAARRHPATPRSCAIVGADRVRIVFYLLVAGVAAVVTFALSLADLEAEPRGTGSTRRSASATCTPADAAPRRHRDVPRRRRRVRASARSCRSSSLDLRRTRARSSPSSAPPLLIVLIGVADDIWDLDWLDQARRPDPRRRHLAGLAGRADLHAADRRRHASARRCMSLVAHRVRDRARDERASTSSTGSTASSPASRSSPTACSSSTATCLVRADRRRPTTSTSPQFIAAVLIGACVGFLPLNWHPAKLFMGDAGALLRRPADGGLGDRRHRAASTPRRCDPTSSAARSCCRAFIPILLPFAVLIVPLLDFGLAVFRRLRAGKSPFTRRPQAPAPPAARHGPLAPARRADLLRVDGRRIRRLPAVPVHRRLVVGDRDHRRRSGGLHDRHARAAEPAQGRRGRGAERRPSVAATRTSRVRPARRRGRRSTPEPSRRMPRPRSRSTACTRRRPRVSVTPILTRALRYGAIVALAVAVVAGGHRLPRRRACPGCVGGLRRRRARRGLPRAHRGQHPARRPGHRRATPRARCSSAIVLGVLAAQVRRLRRARDLCCAAQPWIDPTVFFVTVIVGRHRLARRRRRRLRARACPVRQRRRAARARAGRPDSRRSDEILASPSTVAGVAAVFDRLRAVLPSIASSSRRPTPENA